MSFSGPRHQFMCGADGLGDAAHAALLEAMQPAASRQAGLCGEVTAAYRIRSRRRTRWLLSLEEALMLGRSQPLTSTKKA